MKIISSRITRNREASITTTHIFRSDKSILKSTSTTMTTTMTMTIGHNQSWITSATTTAMGEHTNFGDQLKNGWLQMGRGTKLGPRREPRSTGQRGTDRWGGTLCHRWGLFILPSLLRLDFIIFNFFLFQERTSWEEMWQTDFFLWPLNLQEGWVLLDM